MRRWIAAGILLAFAGIALAAPNCAVSHCVYVPAVSGGGGALTTPTSSTQATSTATVTPTSTSTPTMTPVPVTFLTNGDFENGITGWGAGATVIITTSVSPVPHSGTHLARLEAQQFGMGAELDSADVVVPTSTPYLSYWIWIQSTEPTCGDDIAGVGINSTTIDHFNLCATTQTSGWVHHILDLSAYAGQTETVILIADTFDNNTPNSVFYVDDVGWQAVP